MNNGSDDYLNLKVHSKSELMSMLRDNKANRQDILYYAGMKNYVDVVTEALKYKDVSLSKDDFKILIIAAKYDNKGVIDAVLDNFDAKLLAHNQASASRALLELDGLYTSTKTQDNSRKNNSYKYAAVGLGALLLGTLALSS